MWLHQQSYIPTGMTFLIIIIFVITLQQIFQLGACVGGQEHLNVVCIKNYHRLGVTTHLV